MNVVELTLNLIAPQECAVCNRPGFGLCETCVNNVTLPLVSRCFLCHSLSKNNKTCSVCYNKTKLSRVWVASEYTNNLSHIIIDFKFKRKRGLVKPLAELLAGLLPELSDPPIIVAIPTATTRRRQRGYDHAQLLARQVAFLKGWKYFDALRRQGQTRQVGAKKSVRQEQLRGSFRVARPFMVRDKTVLLIDDVLTTGATLAEAAKVLRQAGAQSVSAAVIAQKS